MFKAVVFDLDGTLVDFRFRVRDAKRALFDRLATHGLDQSLYSFEDSTQTILDKTEQALEKAGSKRSFGSVKRSLEKILDHYELQAAEEAKATPRARETIVALKSSGVRVGLLTNSGRRATANVLRRAGLENLFDVVLTRNEVAKLKPSGSGLGKMSEALATPKSETLYVGDSVLDIRAARDSGVYVAAVVGGIHTRDQLMREGPDYVLDSLSKVAEIVL